jgi:cohesin loading factor subunit SCC2
LNVNPLLLGIVKNPNSTHRRQMGELFQALSAVIPRISNLINAETVAMSDSIIIQAVYISIGPFFVVDSGGDADPKGKKDNVIIKTLGKSAMRGLRLDALSLIRSVSRAQVPFVMLLTRFFRSSRTTKTNGLGLLKKFCRR